VLNLTGIGLSALLGLASFMYLSDKELVLRVYLPSAHGRVSVYFAGMFNS